MRHRDVFDAHDLDVLHELTAPGIEALFDGMERASEALIPNEPVDIVEWIEDNLVITNGPRPGPVELDVIQRSVARAFQEEGARRISWLKPPRAGSSTLLALVHIYFGVHEGYDTIFYERSDPDAQKWHDDRLYPILMASTAIAGALRPDSRSGVQDAWTDRYTRYGAVFQQRGVQTDGAFKAIRGFIVSIDGAGDPAFLGKGKDKEGNKVGLAGRRASEYVGSKLYVGGTPVHEVTGDYETITERAMAFAGISLRRKADIEHARFEHQLLNPMRRAFIYGCVSVGLWSPPPGRPLWEAYLCDWQWPAMQISRMSNELNALIGAVKAEVIDPDTVTTMMFGMRPEVRARRAAKTAARNQALGFKTGAPLWGPDAEAAARILAEAASEEARERDIVEASSREDSVLDDDLD